MTKIISLTVLFAFLSAFVSNANEVLFDSPSRTWTSANGNHQTEAKLIDIAEDGQTITLRQTGGKVTELPLDKLSIEDQQFVRTQQAKFLWVSGDRLRVTLRTTDGKQQEFPLHHLTKASQEYVRKRQADGKAFAVQKERELARERQRVVEEQRKRESTRKEREVEQKSEQSEIAKTGKTRLHQAALDGNLAVVQDLVSKGADVHAKCKEAWTPLHYATSEGHSDVVEFLVSHEADIYAKTKPGLSPLHIAATNGHVEIARFLVSQGADVREKAKENGWTPLHYAAAFGHIDVAKFLVSEGADVNAKLDDGDTPLDCANVAMKIKKYQGRTVANPAMVQYLTDKGSETTAAGQQRLASGTHDAKTLRFVDKSGRVVLSLPNNETNRRFLSMGPHGLSALLSAMSSNNADEPSPPADRSSTTASTPPTSVSSVATSTPSSTPTSSAASERQTCRGCAGTGKKTVQCGICKGSGTIINHTMKTCLTCKGTGTVTAGQGGKTLFTCGVCKGTGGATPVRCTNSGCGGKGTKEITCIDCTGQGTVRK